MIARRVREVQEELLAKKGIDVKDVIITSDEQDPAWWDEVAELGWKSPDHSNTKAEYGRWCVYIFHFKCKPRLIYIVTGIRC